jgi:hypothetical protein
MPISVLALVAGLILYLRRRIKKAQKLRAKQQNQSVKVHPTECLDVTDQCKSNETVQRIKIMESDFTPKGGSSRLANFDHSHNNSIVSLNMTSTNLKETIENVDANAA